MAGATRAPSLQNEADGQGFMRSIRDRTSTTWKGFSDTFRRSARGLFRSPTRAEENEAGPSTPSNVHRHGRRGSILSLFSSPSPTKPTAPANTPGQPRNHQRRSSLLDRLGSLSKKHKSQPCLRPDDRLSRKKSNKPSTWSLNRLKSITKRPNLEVDPDAESLHQPAYEVL